MNQILKTVDFRPSASLRDDYLARFYQEVPLCLEELTLLREVSSRIRYSQEIEHDCLSLLLYFDAPVLQRFFKWVEFLLELKTTVYFEGLIHALVFCFKAQNLVHNQTEFQFEQSKGFLLELDRVETKPMGLMSPLSFLISILISSSVPDIMGSSIKQILKEQQYNGLDPKVDWFRLFFGKDNPLHFLGKHMQDLSTYEMEIMIASLSGESLRRLCQDRFPMSQKEQALLFSGHINLDQPKSPILSRYIIAARLMQFEADAVELVHEYIVHTSTFRNDLETFIKDIEFWQAVTKKLHREVRHNPEVMSNYRIGHLLDYLEFQRYVPGRKIQYSVRGRTISSIMRDMDLWHDLQDFKATREDLKTRWEPLKKGVFKVQKGNEHYRIEEINTGIGLLKEGRRMKHCVFSYLNSCNNYGTHIFSLKQKKKQGYKNLVTIEVQNKTLCQAHTAHNGIVSELQHEIIEDWREEFGILN